MQTRKLGPFEVSALGLGCMSMSQAYGKPDRAESERALHRALDVGYTFLDTACVYGDGHNEHLVGKTLKQRRDEFVLASKCGIYRRGDEGMRIDCRPEVVIEACDASLKRLQVDVIDLYYLHRLDPEVPIEDSVGAMAECVAAGKIKTIGLSEMGPKTIRRAHAVYPITAVQSEYSLCTRVPEGGVLQTCRELGIAFVPFSPLGRAYLAGAAKDMSALQPDDFRQSLPRFQGQNLEKNNALLEEFAVIAADNDCTMAQLALAWLLAQAGGELIPIPGTKHVKFVEENAAAASLTISDADLARCGELINDQSVAGDRYNPARAMTVGKDD